MQIAIDHHDAVAHAGQCRRQNGLFARQQFVTASRRTLLTQQQGRHQQHNQSGAAGENHRIALPSHRRGHCLGPVDADLHLQIAIRNGCEGI